MKRFKELRLELYYLRLECKILLESGLTPLALIDEIDAKEDECAHASLGITLND